MAEHEDVLRYLKKFENYKCMRSTVDLGGCLQQNQYLRWTIATSLQQNTAPRWVRSFEGGT